MKWLVTGGAGFIGGHVVHALLRRGYDAVVLDDFSTGRTEVVPDGVPLYRGTLLDPSVIEEALREPDLTGVIHIAGYKYAGESVGQPLHTYEQNVVGMMNLLEGMQKRGLSRIIFSSSAAVYGDVDVDVIREDHPTKPANPYGESKLIGEWLLHNIGVAHGLKHSSLRYFNVVGSSEPGIFDTSPHSLFSLVFAALAAGKVPKIFGSDYPTRDGTCVRDYIPVGPLAEAHVVAAERLVGGESLEPAYNIGTGTGHSVAEVMGVMAQVTGIDFEAERVARRPGDPATVVASGELARRDLGWDPRTDLIEMVESAWAAHQNQLLQG
jgi:UDP-glucose 4-epimerase